MWVVERIRDVGMWPVNLLRDAGVRNGRLRQTLWAGVVGCGYLVRGEGVLGRFLFGLHRLLAELFDVVGGPEMGQFLMHLITHTSPLTAERRLEKRRAMKRPSNLRNMVAAKRPRMPPGRT